MKNFFRTIHLYLGLAAGLVIATVCFTGATMVFEKELLMLFHPERYKIEKGTQRISVDEAVASLQKTVSGATVNSVKIYRNPDRTMELVFAPQKKDGPKENQPSNKNERAVTKTVTTKKPEPPGRGSRGIIAFINPYTGNVTGTYDQGNSFFYTMLSLHRWLLAGDVGKLIVGTSTLLFLFILITGIILWWPKTMAKIKKRITLKFNGGWKRINHDLHIVIGFYAAIFLFSFAFTGLAWSFQWFNNGIYWVTRSENKRPEAPPSVLLVGEPAKNFDAILTAAQAIAPHAEFYTINKPRDSAGAFTVTIMPLEATHERATDQYYFDQYSGQLIGSSVYTERNLGQRTRSTFYPIHVGSIGGLPGKIIAFLACLAGFTFPITGVIIWRNRLRKKNRKKAKSKKSPVLIS